MSTPPGPAGPTAPAISPDTRLVWVCSYPKSGNTWVRFLLYHYFHPPAENSQQIARFIPDLHVRGDVQASRPRDGVQLVKTHFPLDDRLPGLSLTKAYIYVIRHPRDTILSCLNYIRLVSGDTLGPRFPEEKYVRSFMHLGGAKEYISLKFGTWEGHYRSWLDQSRIPGVLVRYEDLKKQPAVELRRLIEFLGQTPDEARIEAAVKHSTFDQMRALEVREKSAGKSPAVFMGAAEGIKRGTFFMNKGQSGRSLESIAPGLDRAVDTRFAEALKRFRYAT